MSSLPRTNIFIDNDDGDHHQYSMDNRSSSSSSTTTTTTTSNINNRFDQDGLILPKKLSIPSLESREKKEMHREILWKIKHGQTTDPKRDNEYHKVYQQYQQRQRNKEKLIESLSFERMLELQKQRLNSINQSTSITDLIETNNNNNNNNTSSSSLPMDNTNNHFNHTQINHRLSLTNNDNNNNNNINNKNRNKLSKSSSLTGHNNHKTTNNNNNHQQHQHGMISNPIGNNTTKRSDSLL